MKNTLKITVLIALTFSFINAKAIIKEVNRNNPTDVGIKSFIHDPVSELPPQKPGGPTAQTVFTYGDDIELSNQYDILLLEEEDFGDNGILDWQYVMLYEDDTTNIRGWYNNFSPVNAILDWDYIQGGIIDGHDSFWFRSGGDNNLQPGNWRGIVTLEGVSFSQVEFTILPAPGQFFNPDGALKADVNNAAISTESNKSASGFSTGNVDPAIIETKED